MSLTVLNDANFSSEVLESDVPVLVDFYAVWCSPCKAIAAALVNLAAEFDGRLKVGKLNIDEAPQAPTQFTVRAIPTLIFFKDGQPVNTIVGSRSEGELRSQIEQILA